MSQDEFNQTDTENTTPDDGTQDTLDALNNPSETMFVTGEEKKPANRTTMVMFLIIALGGGGLYFMHWRTGPSSAAAGTVKSADTATANKTIGQFLSGGPSNIKSMETMLRNTEKVVQQFNAYPSVKQIPLSNLQTNPFRQASANDPSAEDEEAKKKLEDQRLAVQKSFQSLQLQSIMHGGSKNTACLINNTLYREGQTVNGFSIEKISTDSVSIRQGAWRFDLKMQK
jgi:hypothetical protein